MNQGIEYGQAGEQSKAAEFLMPSPTFLPLLLAAGLMVIFAGFIFNIYISYVGIVITLVAAVGWWSRVIPSEAHEYVPLELKHRPSAVRVNPNAVTRLKAGADQHRAHVPEETHSYSSGAVGGLAGGIAMAVLACLYGFIAQSSIWYPVNLLAGMVMPTLGNESVAQLRTFDGGAFAAALFGHISLSVLVGVLYAVTIPMFPKRFVIWSGIVMPIIWSALILTLLNLLNPALNDKINWPWFVVCQIAFGLVCGAVIAKSAPIKTMQSWTMAERAAMMAPGILPERGEKK